MAGRGSLASTYDQERNRQKAGKKDKGALSALKRALSRLFGRGKGKGKKEETVSEPSKPGGHRVLTAAGVKAKRAKEFKARQDRMDKTKRVMEGTPSSDITPKPRTIAPVQLNQDVISKRSTGLKGALGKFFGGFTRELPVLTKKERELFKQKNKRSKSDMPPKSATEKSRPVKEEWYKQRPKAPGEYDRFSFGNAFNKALKDKGEGEVFTWRDKQYLLKNKKNKKK
jgi:hypothetical protein